MSRLYRSMLKRDYPEFIKCSWVSDAELSSISDQLDKVRELGMNTICVMISVPEYAVDPRLFEEVNVYFTQYELVSIKRSGMAVFLTLDAAGIPRVEKKLSEHEMEEFLKAAEKTALRWGKFAEDYKIDILLRLANCIAGYMIRMPGEKG